MAPQCLMSHGTRFELTEVEDESGYWGRAYLGRTLASLDYDRDGDLDLLVNHLDESLALLQSATRTDGRWMQLEVVGRSCERDAIGARVIVRTTSGNHAHWVTAGDGYFCSDEPVLDFGLGADVEVESVEIRWPSGELQVFKSPEANRRYLIVEGHEELYQR